MKEILRAISIVNKNTRPIHKKFKKISLAYFSLVIYYNSCGWHSDVLSARPPKFFLSFIKLSFSYKEAIQNETETSG
ncbi:MAG: hypothetical protein SO073_08320 [Candidatus Onthomonas sp.]|nr:hypothetical protein [Candidatus Onthomonas sp.]